MTTAPHRPRHTPQPKEALVLPFRRLEDAPGLSGSVLFFDHVLRPPGSDHVFIGLKAPRAEDVIPLKASARAILQRNWEDTGHLRADLMRAVVKSLYQYVPEYALAASPQNPDGTPEKMPRVVIGLGDGRQVNLGRPDGSGVLSAVFAENSGLAYRYPAKKPERFMPSHENPAPWRHRNLDLEFESQYDPEWDNDAIGPVVDVFAAILAATVESRRLVQEVRAIRTARGQECTSNSALCVEMLAEDQPRKAATPEAAYRAGARTLKP